MNEKIANWDLNSGWFYWLQCNLVLSDFEGHTGIVTAGGLWLVKLLFCFLLCCSCPCTPWRLDTDRLWRLNLLKTGNAILNVMRSFRASTRTSVLWCQNACQVRKMRACWQVWICSAFGRVQASVSGRKRWPGCFFQVATKKNEGGLFFNNVS